MRIDPSDNRTPLIHLLENYVAIDDEDDRQRNQILAFVTAHPKCFERSHWSGHITGSAWLMDQTGEKVLLTHHKKLGKWLQLGGHADGDCDIQAVALREAYEESGLKKGIRPLSNRIFDVDIHPIPARTNEPAHYHYDVRFVFQAVGSDPVLAGRESIELAWINIRDLHSFSNEESLHRMTRKWKLLQFATNRTEERT
ncbi:MAG: hypothetical protein KCHDKBKB_01897 [Elusimicrobia bacterium]|nr:hypothetical protein [Elusimicrobiota bacterium]